MMPYTYPSDYKEGPMTLTDHADAIKATRIQDMPGPAVDCPVCNQALIPDAQELTYDEIEKMLTWTLAQLIAWNHLQTRSGLTRSEMLERTSPAGTERPGIGGALYGSQGLVGVNDFHGMFVGIEPDGYTHS